MIIPIPTDAKDLKGLRDFCNNIRAQACSMAATTSGPLKQVWDDLAEKYNQILSGLPTTTDGTYDLASQISCFFSALVNANAVASMATMALGTANSTLATNTTLEVNRLVESGELIRKADLAAKIETGVTAKVAADFVAKDTATQLCSDAKLTGIAEGKAAALADITAAEARKTVIATRSAALTTAGLPLPDAEVEKILGGTEEEFNAAKALFETRKAEIKTAGITLASAPLLAKLWLVEDKYAAFRGYINEIPALKVTPEPFAGGGNPSGAPAPVRVVI
jgi:hypothetical protein